MKERVTRKHINTLVNIIKSKGYWSNEVRDYLSQFSYPAATRLNDKAKLIIRMEAE